MTTKQAPVELCAVCRFDGGWHFDDPDNPTRPHHEAARLREAARILAEISHDEAKQKAREIVEAAAAQRFEFSANDLHAEFDKEGVPESLHAGAFTWAHKQGLIVPTGRGVMSKDPKTRHRLNVWRSVERARQLGQAC